MPDREYAYFRVTGFGSHHEITKLLGCEPTKAWSEGDDRPSGGKYSFMFWQLDSGYERTETLDKHIEGVLIKCKSMADNIFNLSHDYTCGIVCVGYYSKDSHGLHLNRQQLQQMADLGIELDCDYYFVDNKESAD